MTHRGDPWAGWANPADAFSKQPVIKSAASAVREAISERERVAMGLRRGTRFLLTIKKLASDVG